MISPVINAIRAVGWSFTALALGLPIVMGPRG